MAVPEAKIEEVVAATTTAVQRGGRASGVLSVLLQGLGLTLVVAAGTLAGQFLYGLLGHAERVPAVHDAADAGKKPVQAEVKKKAPDGPPVYHAFEPLVVNFEESGELRFLQLTVEVMAHDPKAIAAVQANTPFLRNNLLLLIGSRDLKQLLTREGKEQLRALALAEVRAVLQKVSPESEIEDVYFSSFVMQ
ncbi:MAG: flagellar basal body-associated FliL family protein [Steroidobacteraceae bacterium]|nr:flagellar basal body-associated FliL family protein [Pseudomonadota bacterium]MBP6106588.1 flagellar basal body-associated FliL family protein [Steroidobacteraceae bacterium]MBP7014331.1 flagellar basal body-associated FliL family protein [Steroidobacteraceae bacterium]